MVFLNCSNPDVEDCDLCPNAACRRAVERCWTCSQQNGYTPDQPCNMGRRLACTVKGLLFSGVFAGK